MKLNDAPTTAHSKAVPMLMLFEPHDQDFGTAAGALADRVDAWAREHGAEADTFTVGSALEYRHHGTVDGRLGLWQERHVGEFLLDWLPRQLTVLPGQPLPDGPGDLLALLRYLDAMGLADPRGDALPVLERAVGAAAGEFADAMADRTRWGPAKFWAATAAEQGVDVTDPDAMTRFTERARRDEVPYDRRALDTIMRRHLLTGPARVPRAEPQLPVVLPPEDVLREQAAATASAGQLAGLAAWAGSGQPLTRLGRLRVADARRLAETLETGDRATAPRSSAELPRLSLLFAMAKQARLIRVAKGRAYAVAKARPVIADPLALWERAFTALFELREPLLGGTGWSSGPSLLYTAYEDVLPDVLNTLYSLPHPMPWPRLRASVHFAYGLRFDLGAVPEHVRRLWLLAADRDLRRVLDALEDLGAIAREQGMADPAYLDMTGLDGTPGEDADSPEPPDGLPPELARPLGAVPGPPDPDSRASAQALREELTAGPVELIRLTDLGTYAVRQRLLAEGRSAPLVGELAHACATAVLGVVSQEYDPDSARAELSAWAEAHGGPEHARGLLLDAVRESPFRVRSTAFLDTLTAALPEGQRLPHSLRGDPQLAPTALSVLTHRDILAPEDLTGTESALLVAESLLQLLESGDQDVFVEHLLAAGRRDAQTMIGAALGSGHPDRDGLARLARIADGPLRARATQLGRLNAARARRRQSGAGKRGRRR
ncbi:hypothetical protein ACFP1Z_14040 [Streptomyces gamaensis]|uniref:Uncharacterized protein n=1 Tax=Streptomyces gamaensis TaxID=1763542 RepID=A0ABW0Z054_9ACTN